MTDIPSPAQRAEALEYVIEFFDRFNSQWLPVDGLVPFSDYETAATVLLDVRCKYWFSEHRIAKRSPLVVLRSIEMAPTDADGSPLEGVLDEESEG